MHQPEIRKGIMTNIKVVSIDMFRTLVDLKSVEQLIWHMILKDKYTVALAEECSAHAGNSLFKYLQQNKFLPLKSIFMGRWTELFSNLAIDFNPDQIRMP